MRRFSPHLISAWPALLRYDRLTVVVKRWWVLAPLLVTMGALWHVFGIGDRSTAAWLAAGVLVLAALVPARGSETRVRRWLIDRHGLLDETLLQPAGPLDPDGPQHLKLVTEARDRSVDARTYLPRPPAVVAAVSAPWLAVLTVLWLPVGAVADPSSVPDPPVESGPPSANEAVPPAAESSQARATPEPQPERQPESAAEPTPEPGSTSPDVTSSGADGDLQATAPERDPAQDDALPQSQERDTQAAGSEPSGPEASGSDRPEFELTESQPPPPPEDAPRPAERDTTPQQDDGPADAATTQSAEASGEPTNADPSPGLNGAEGDDADTSASGSPQADAPNASESQTAPSSTPAENEDQAFEARPAQAEGQPEASSEDSATSAPRAPTGDDASQRQDDVSGATRDEGAPEIAGTSSSEPGGTATERSQDGQTPVRAGRDDAQGTATPSDAATRESVASEPVASEPVADGPTSSEERRQLDVQDSANASRAADRTQSDTSDRAANPAPTQDLGEEQANPAPTTGTTTDRPADTLPAPQRPPQNRVAEGSHEPRDRPSSSSIEGSRQPSSEDSALTPAGRDRDVRTVPPAGDAPVLPQDRETVERYFTDDAAP